MILVVKDYYLSLISSFEANSFHVLNFNSGVMLAICKHCALLPLNLDSKLRQNKKTDKNFQDQHGDVHVCVCGSACVCTCMLRSKVKHSTPDMLIKEQMICIIIQHLGFRKET